ncbi:MAG: hypothetical protein LUE93_08230 [Bacteroides sp.]|nr:hypothetical protein [Bacteroides sp.]
MISETAFAELEERVVANESSIEEIKDTTLWGQSLQEDVKGSLKNVGSIDFETDNVYTIGTDDKRPGTIYSRTGIRVGNTSNSTDGKDGIRLNKDGSIGIQCSDESVANGLYPRIALYHGSNPTAITSLYEATPGVLSITNKLRVGDTAKQAQESTLFVEGNSCFNGTCYHQKALNVGIGKTHYNDGVSGVTIGGNPFIALLSAEDSTEEPRIAFGKGTEITSRIRQGYPGILSLVTHTNEGVFIREYARQSSLNGYRLMVSGNSYFTGIVNAQSKIWMNSNKIHLGPYTTGVSGLSFVCDRGVVLESALDNSTYEKASNIELYARESGNIVLNPTNGKALYKDAEIATVETTTVLDNRMAALEAEILGANAALSILETNSI